jgi:Protein of unknown function (DUF3025)
VNAPLLAGPDPARPWLAPYRGGLEGLFAGSGSGSVAEALNQAATAQGGIEHAAGRLRFVAPDAAPPGEPYEAFIARTACVPTRDNLHDLFNGIAWLRFPQIKRHLNALQAAQIAAHGVGARRGAVRDALTLFDENGAWLQAPPVLAEALRARDWRALFVTHRAAWHDARLVLFGHALLEKLCTPRPAITAHTWLLPAGADPAAAMLDELTPERLAVRSHHPLPVLGVPGWWPANEAPAFYDDAGVFRAPPLRRGEIRN